MGALEQNPLAGSDRLIEEDGGVAEVTFETRANLFQLREDLAAIDGFRLENGLQVEILVADIAFELFSERARIHQIVEAKPGASHLVFVSRPNSESSGADGA